MAKGKIINLYAGPGTGKSTTCAALFAELKYMGVNTEMALEYAKDATWENRGDKFFRAQDYIFAKQHFRIQRVIEDVDFVVTDSPLLLSLIYMRGNDMYYRPFEDFILDTYNKYDNIDIFINRNKPYNPKGRRQSLDEAIGIDNRIRDLLGTITSDDYYTVDFGRHNVEQIINILKDKGWIK